LKRSNPAVAKRELQNAARTKKLSAVLLTLPQLSAPNTPGKTPLQTNRNKTRSEPPTFHDPHIKLAIWGQ
jgi:hypothetical protein